MLMQGMHLTGKAPWPRLYLHGLVRAADGAKMSKSKGNVVDPLGLIDQYGADALRFFMAAMESQGRDIKMDERRVEGYRNFATKLWNATRFCQSNGIGASTGIAAPAATQAVNKWIIGEVVETKAALDQAMADLRFDAAANTIYHFVWDRFCDWYIELIKGNFDAETKAVAGWALDQILVMLHPFMPFVTEELWSKQGERPDYPLITASWPDPQAEVDADAKAEVDWLIALTSAVRTAKNELGIAPGAKLAAFCPSPSALGRKVAEENAAAIERLARLTPIHFAEAPAGAAMQVAAGDDAFVIPLDGVIDIEAEKARLTKALEAFRQGSQIAGRSPRQREFRRTRQARSRRQGARRPCASHGGDRAVASSTDAAWLNLPVRFPELVEGLSLLLAWPRKGNAGLRQAQPERILYVAHFRNRRHRRTGNLRLRAGRRAELRACLSPSCACRGATLPACGATRPTPGISKATSGPIATGSSYDRKANQITLGEAEVAERILALGQNRLVITGGEPLLQAPALAKLLDLLPDISVEVETNGTTKAPPALDARIDQFNVSPKLAHSGNPADLALLPERLEAYAADPRALFKFVIAEPSDVDEVLALRDRYGFMPGHVFLMPEGTDSATLREREKWLADLCLKHGFRLSDRLHIHLFGDTRGT